MRRGSNPPPPPGAKPVYGAPTPNSDVQTDQWRDDHTDRINPLIAGQWAAAIVFCLSCLGFVAWAVHAVFHLIKGA